MTAFQQKQRSICSIIFSNSPLLLPMITKEKMVIAGIETITPDEWPYAYGPEAE